MKTNKALKKYKEFHLKEPDAIVRLRTSLPRVVYAVGYCPQISYHSNKWMKDGTWNSYIHWWENPTLICVAYEMVKEMPRSVITEFDKYMLPLDLGPSRNEVVFLGYAIDFSLSADDRSHIDVGPSTVFVRNSNPQSKGEIERMKDTYTFKFNSVPGRSKDYVACSPDGKMVYVISDSNREVYAFYNKKCKVTTHGIEG